MASSLPNIAKLSLASHQCNKPDCHAFTSPVTHPINDGKSGFTRVSASAGGQSKVYYTSQPQDPLAPHQAPKPLALAPKEVAVVYDRKYHWDVCWNKCSTFCRKGKSESESLFEWRMKQAQHGGPGPSRLRQVSSAEDV